MLIELAGIPVEVICRHPANESFLKEYVTDKAPLVSVAPTDADLIRMQADFDRMDKSEGRPPHRRSGAFLENNAIHALLAEKLVDFDVLLVHGSALCMDGKAYIFTAPSGTGKSTHARLWREVYGDRVIMINDDKPMLKISETGATVYGTPWNGKHHLSCNACAPLEAIVELNRDVYNHMEPMTGADAFPLMMKHSYGSKDPGIMKKTMELRERLLDTVSFYRLGCNMSPEAAKVAYETLINLS